MKPDRSNFEIWIADWLAGNLTVEQREHFMIFLEQNPDLKEEADSLSLTFLSPGKRSFEPKGLLKKSPADLHPTQVEYLSVAHLEDDISPGQLEDLNNCINNNPESRRLFESVRKVKLVPPDYRYGYKDRLKKKSKFENILYLAYPTLGAAAAVAIIILSFVFVPKFLSFKQNKIAINTVTQNEPVILYSKVLMVPEEKSSVTEPTEKADFPASGEIGEPVSRDIPIVAELSFSDSSEILLVMSKEPAIFRITDFPGFRIDILDKQAGYSLIASNIEYREPVYDDRNGLSKFLARTFREKILREDSGSDAPVKPYEIASAGINGISRLFGLEMALVKVSDEQGEMKSLYFSSRLLKINAPVKKDEVLQ
jgi:hypothetical protein